MTPVRPEFTVLFFRLGELGKDISNLVRELLELDLEAGTTPEQIVHQQSNNADLAVGMQVVREALGEVRKLRHVVGDERRAAIVAAYNAKTTQPQA